MPALWGGEAGRVRVREPSEAGPNSDIDVLYELVPGSRLGWDIEDLADELSQLLGHRVDLISRNALHERLRDEVLAQARLLYAA